MLLSIVARCRVPHVDAITFGTLNWAVPEGYAAVMRVQDLLEGLFFC